MEERQPVRSIEGGHDRIGFLLGDVPWSQQPSREAVLLSPARVAHGLSRALSAVGEVVPYRGPHGINERNAFTAMAHHLEQVDVIWGEAGASPGTDLALRVRQETGIDRPVVILACGAMPRGLEAMLLPWQDLLRPGDGIAFTCAAGMEMWRRLADERTMVESVIPLPLDDSVFHPSDPAERPAVRGRYGLPADAPLLLYVGRLNVQKNLHGLLHMLARTRQRIPTAHLAVVGTADDVAFAEFHVRNTGYVAWLRRLTAELGLEHAVTFLGPLPLTDLAAVYACADVAVDLGFSHGQDFGLALAEALACGTPVVCSDWGAFRDIVPHDTSGYRVDTVLTNHGIRADFVAAADRVAEILADPALRARLGRGAAAWATSHFTLEAAGRALAGLSNRLLDTRRPPVAAPYQPSELAFRYELHKRACGWYERWGTPPDGDPAALPRRRLFQAADYQLYQVLVGPNATRVEGASAHPAMADSGIPHLGPFVRLDHDRLLVFDEDPIWPHRRFCDQVTWAVLSRIDGGVTIAEIAETTALDHRLVRTTVWQLQADGFVL